VPAGIKVSLASAGEGTGASDFEGGLASTNGEGLALGNERRHIDSPESLPDVKRAETQADFDHVPPSTVHHFFVDTNSSDPMLTEEVASLDPTVSAPESITQFLILPTITARANPQRRLTDPVVDFTKSIMLTSDGYLNAVQQLQERRNQSS
jgi:hypothetical protein